MCSRSSLTKSRAGRHSKLFRHLCVFPVKCQSKGVSDHPITAQNPTVQVHAHLYGLTEETLRKTKGEHLIWEMILILNKLNLEVNTFKCIFRQWNLNTTAHIRPFTFWHFRRSWGSITVWEKSPWLVVLHDGQFIDCSLAVLKETKSH